MRLTDAEFAEFEKHPLFASLSQPPLARNDGELRDLFRDRVRLKKCGKDTLVFEEGDAPDHVYVVKSGTAKIVLKSEEGDEAILGFAVRGDMFGEIAVIDGKQRTASVHTIEQTMLYEIPRQLFITAFEQNAGVAQALTRHLIGSLRRTTAQLRSKFLYESRRGVLDQLLRCSAIERKGDRILLNPTHQINEIAQILALRRETVSRALRDLQDPKKGPPIEIKRGSKMQITSIVVPLATIDALDLPGVLEELRPAPKRP